MYKLVPANALPLKTYWCADLQVASEVAKEIRERFDCACEILEVQDKNSWQPENLLDAALCIPQRVRAFEVKPGFRFACSTEQLEDALSHARGGILKIKDTDEIFCFRADDPFWQRQYQYQHV